MFTEKVKMCLYTSPGILSCPYRLSLRCLDSANITISMSPEFLFRNVVFLKSVGKYVLGDS